MWIYLYICLVPRRVHLDVNNTLRRREQTRHHCRHFSIGVNVWSASATFSPSIHQSHSGVTTRRGGEIQKKKKKKRERERERKKIRCEMFRNSSSGIGEAPASRQFPFFLFKFRRWFIQLRLCDLFLGKQQQPRNTATTTATSTTTSTTTITARKWVRYEKYQREGRGKERKKMEGR